jgi:hypothetical protein
MVLILAACIAPPLPSESTTVGLDLSPGTSQILAYRATVESEVDAFIEISMMPTPQTLAATGIEASLHSTVDGGERLDRWPDGFGDAVVETGTTHIVDFDVELTNPGVERQSIELVIRVHVDSNDLPQPFPDEVSITLIER